MNRLNQGEKTFLGASALFFILTWIPAWAKVSIAGFSESGNGWESYGFWGKLALILALAGLVIGGLKLAGQQVNVPSVALVGIGALVLLCTVLMLLVGPDVEGADAIPGVDVDRGLLLYVGIVLGAAMTYGGYQAMQAEGTTTTPPPSA
jgi:hypothetical protein